MCAQRTDLLPRQHGPARAAVTAQPLRRLEPGVAVARLRHAEPAEEGDADPRRAQGMVQDDAPVVWLYKLRGCTAGRRQHKPLC
jgi:hypothetical protein